MRYIKNECPCLIEIIEIIKYDIKRSNSRFVEHLITICKQVLFMRTTHLFDLIHIRYKHEVGAVKHV